MLQLLQCKFFLIMIILIVEEYFYKSESGSYSFREYCILIQF